MTIRQMHNDIDAIISLLDHIGACKEIADKGLIAQVSHGTQEFADEDAKRLIPAFMDCARDAHEEVQERLNSLSNAIREWMTENIGQSH